MLCKIRVFLEKAVIFVLCTDCSLKGICSMAILSDVCGFPVYVI